MRFSSDTTLGTRAMGEPSAAPPLAGEPACPPRVVIRAHSFQSPADAPKLHGCSQSLEPGELPSQTVSVSRRLSVIDSSAIRLEDLPSNPEHWLPSQLRVDRVDPDAALARAGGPRRLCANLGALG